MEESDEPFEKFTHADVAVAGKKKKNIVVIKKIPVGQRIQGRIIPTPRTEIPISDIFWIFTFERYLSLHQLPQNAYTKFIQSCIQQLWSNEKDRDNSRIKRFLCERYLDRIGPIMSIVSRQCTETHSTFIQ